MCSVPTTHYAMSEERRTRARPGYDVTGLRPTRTLLNVRGHLMACRPMTITSDGGERRKERREEGVDPRGGERGELVGTDAAGAEPDPYRSRERRRGKVPPWRLSALEVRRRDRDILTLIPNSRSSRIYPLTLAGVYYLNTRVTFLSLSYVYFLEAADRTNKVAKKYVRDLPGRFCQRFFARSARIGPPKWRYAGVLGRYPTI